MKKEATEMGYRNMDRVFALAHDMRFAEEKHGAITINSYAMMVLMYMARHTYDFPPENKVESEHKACRFYQGGIDTIVDAFNLNNFTYGELLEMKPEEEKDRRQARLRTKRNQVSRAMRWLEEHGLIKRLRKSSWRFAAGYMLMLGDDAENAACERWNRTASDFFRLQTDVGVNLSDGINQQDDSSEGWSEPDSD